ncbi:copper resistance protein NlpE N-terminal domain-containing protein [Shewanella sp. SG44-6]|uniref:copper resistance protein NlpE n=1 Tax=Shewanella sp. SG44-6 TaxID=2760959 RepID=UPI001603C345|nr:copper resistance protein NlpE [Shewanella sp. SG44-6]MBB1391232.1 copper resistance protein NlpE N-terminal domain-containing protein [Shewanella sp. SG44-6]
MKNVWLIFILIILGCGQQDTSNIDTTTSSKTDLQWQGVYHGIFPCPSCDGMDTTLELIKPNKYTIYTVRLGTDNIPFQGSGTFKWDKTGNIIILDRGHIYRIYSDHLYLLDVKSRRIKGADAQRYRVNKIQALDQQTTTTE